MAFRMFFRLALAVIATIATSSGSVYAQGTDWAPAALSDSLGSEINATQREAYHLFPDIKGFVSARFLTKPGPAYRLEYSYQSPSGVTKTTSRRITPAAWGLARAHVALVETGLRRNATPLPVDQSQSEMQYRLALKFAAAGRYDVSHALVSDLLSEYPGTPVANDAATVQADITRLSQTRRALFLPGGLLDQSGRTDVLVFSGYYGVWAGIAIPVCLNSHSSEVYALGLLTGAPGALLLTSRLTRDAELGRGRASVITLGGHLGTWQGLGWGGVSGWDERGVVAAGLVGGLVGITGATLWTRDVYITEGHGSLMSSSMNWGAWFGLTTAVVAGLEDDNVLRAALIGSDVLVVTAGIAARNVHMSRGRVRLISLMGLVGTVAGFGLDALVNVDDGKVVMAVAGLGSVTGLLLGARITRDYDAGKDLASASPNRSKTSWTLSPQLTLAADPVSPSRFIPMAGFRLSF
ncbi:MAG: hypothetical protein HZB43_13065 [candidate division Zixibacteria bacterium]|nr:hypothetical protein [candidate division Zixibacteria bacterium]